MSLLDCLLPANPPEPSQARVVLLLGVSEPVTSKAKREGNRRHYERNRERINQLRRLRYQR